MAAMRNLVLVSLVSALLLACGTVEPNRYASAALASAEGQVSRAHQDNNLISYYLTQGAHKRYIVQLVEPGTGVVETLVDEERVFIDLAEACQWADVASTVIGITMFAATEANPIGLALLPAKYFTNARAEYLPKAACQMAKASLSGFGCGAAAMNVVTMASDDLTVISAISGVLIGIPTYRKGKKYAGCEDWIGDPISPKKYR